VSYTYVLKLGQLYALVELIQKWQAGQGGTHLAICSKFPVGILANLLVGEYPQSPFEHYLAVVATPPAEAHKTRVSSSLFLCFFFSFQEVIIS
jgi:hypothetical protein